MFPGLCTRAGGYIKPTARKVFQSGPIRHSVLPPPSFSIFYLLLPQVMKDLIRRILERAAEDGGEEWLKKCLAEMESEPALVAEEDGEVAGPSDAFQQPLLPQTPSLPYRCSRTQPPERSLAVSAAREDEVSSLGGTSDTTPQRSSLRIQKKKRTASPSPVRVTTGRGRGRQSPVKGRRDLFSLQVPMEEQTASPVARQTQLDNVTAPQRLEFLSRPASSSQRDDSSASQAGAATSSGSLSSIWIIGHSFVHWAHIRACQRCYSSNLSLPPDSFKIFWKGIRGLRWDNLCHHISNLSHSLPYPDILIIHLGGNDIGKYSTLDLIFKIKRDLQHIHLSFPSTKIIFSEMIPRFLWLSFPENRSLEKIRRRVNHSIEKFMPILNSFSYRHTELEGGFSGLYRSDGIHLSDIGLDIFNSDLQNMVEMATVLG
ncbi:uncharacterized protein LOC120936645 [Rana temporaria]|uniref:uncharacterized protein LOC120915294 n=2 Tax=Rana temporaria TaxID=8407 RepID=UPI001AAD2C1C|nr:uncharacterized protein LOC120915294 [Rana temporaria]XP_040203552.1 uncharacterized protein LOC120935570 [Rana temporaria]XP_040204501.1 uncharacterized protein LOC120936320 [Rana temporaria]XP_040205083.1 uncharacterized protein LOC120936645 [Rana temporaria]